VTLGSVGNAWGSKLGLLYTTNRHSADAHDFVAVLPYARAASPAEHVRIFAWARVRSRDAGLPVDPGAGSAARFFFLPGAVPGDPFEVHELVGKPIDPDFL